MKIYSDPWEYGVIDNFLSPEEAVEYGLIDSVMEERS